MIHVLSGNAYAGGLPKPQSTGISPIFRGKINVGEQSLRCYIKPMPDSITVAGKAVENREALSEALGYTLARSAGYSVPDAAGIIMLASNQIPPDVLEHLRQTGDGSLQQDYVAWFSQDMQHPSLLRHIAMDAPSHLQEQQLRRLALKLASHGDTAAIVTFDEWTENSDRNLGNLLESPSGKLMLIDHGRIFRWADWQPAHLSVSKKSLRNVIRELVDHYTPHWSETLQTKGARGMAYNTLANTWRKEGAAAARALLAEFLDDMDTNHVLDFLTSRLEPVHYNKAVGLLV